MTNLIRAFVILFFVTSLAGCKITLYSGLSESEANQMLALLELKKISSDKEIEKGGAVALKVDKKDFVNAVETLRQSGLPRLKRVEMAEVFPSNQLVTSPAQERAKMVFLKEQQLETMIGAMDGVVSANVSIAAKTDESGKATGGPSAAVLIKYSPEVNLLNYEAQIKNLVRDGISDIAGKDISVLMQPAEFRYQDTRHVKSKNQLETLIDRVGLLAVIASTAVITLLLASACSGMVWWQMRRSSRRKLVAQSIGS